MTNFVVISREEAKVAGLTRYFTGIPCKHGHVAERRVHNMVCFECHRIAAHIRLRARAKFIPKYRDKEHLRNLRRRRATPEKRRADNAYHRLIRDPVAWALRSRFGAAIRGKAKTGSAVRDLGCTIVEFKEHIAAKFTEDMSWDNWGSVWELDHIQRLAGFDLENRSQILAACHFSNYQPLLIADHRAKTASENRVTMRAAA